jgi:hypothetical protein
LGRAGDDAAKRSVRRLLTGRLRKEVRFGDRAHARRLERPDQQGRAAAPDGKDQRRGAAPLGQRVERNPDYAAGVLPLRLVEKNGVRNVGGGNAKQRSIGEIEAIRADVGLEHARRIHRPTRSEVEIAGPGNERVLADAGADRIFAKAHRESNTGCHGGCVSGRRKPG